MTDIAIDSNGQVYGVDAQVDAQGVFIPPSRLYKVNLPGASTTLVGSLGVLVNSLEFRDDGLLFAAGANLIYHVNTTTGAATTVVALQAGYQSAGDIEFDADGNMYVTMANGSLIRIAPDLSIWQDLGSTGFGDFFGLISGSDRSLYGFREAEQIYRIDPRNGSATFIANIADVSVVRIFGAATDVHPGLPPAAPSDLLATGFSNSVRLQWVDHSNNEDAFGIERRIGLAGAYTPLVQVGSNVTVYQDTGLPVGVTYCYRLYAFTAGVNSAYSNEGCGTALAAPVLSLPADGATITTNLVTLQWNPVAAAEAYGVDLGTTCGSHSILGSEAKRPSTSIQVSNVADGRYYWRVDAANLSYPGFSAFSECRSFTIAAGPSAITISGHAVAVGLGESPTSGRPIKGDGLPPDRSTRTVTLMDATGNTRIAVVSIDDQGAYRITAPPGRYILRADIGYPDIYTSYDDLLGTPTASQAPRHARSTTAPKDFQGDTSLAITFPRPLVLLHGIIVGPERWGAWVRRLQANDGVTPDHPATILFTPGYYARGDYTVAAENVCSQLADDFARLFVTAPPSALAPPYRVIAHSKGGLVARVLKGSRCPVAGTMTDVVLLGTSNNGTDCFRGLDDRAGYRLTKCAVETDVTAHHPDFGDATVHAVAGTNPNDPFIQQVPGPVTCLGEPGPRDGAVPVDSVMTISKDGKVDAASGQFDGIVVNAAHTQLGSADTIWLLERILTYYATGAFPLNCPPDYHRNTTDPAVCGDPTPVYKGCLVGKGYNAWGVCDVSQPSPGSRIAEIAWQPPLADLAPAPPILTNAGSTISTGAPSCGSDSGVGSGMSAQSPDVLLGYNIYRSADLPMVVDGSRRVGATVAGATAFTDPYPRAGQNYYAVTAVYNSGETGPSNALSVVISGSAACSSTGGNLCLTGNRFSVSVDWRARNLGREGVGIPVALTYDTGYFWFFSSNNVELVVKVVDGRAFNGYFWVFYGALSDVEYTITVTDTVTGAVKTYTNPQGQLASVADTAAFSGGSAGGSAAGVSLQTTAAVANLARSESEEVAQILSASSSLACTNDATTLCLNNGRFQVRAIFSAPNLGITNAPAQSVPLTSDTGYFWFFSSNNVEIVLKAVDGRTFNGFFWVFYGALSDVEYTITVTDAVTGAVKTYTNPQGRLASVADTSAFRP